MDKDICGEVKMRVKVTVGVMKHEGDSEFESFESGTSHCFSII